MNNYKIRSVGRIIPIIMLALMMILSTPTSVLALNEAPVTEVKATDLSDALDYDGKVSTNGSVLTIEVRDARAGVPGAANWSAIGYLTGSPFVREKFTGTTCTMTYDFSQYKDGIKTLSVIVFVEGATTDTTMWSRDIFLKISGGQVSIYNPYGQSAVDFLNKLNAERLVPATMQRISLMMQLFQRESLSRMAREYTLLVSRSPQNTKFAMNSMVVTPLSWLQNTIRRNSLVMTAVKKASRPLQ